MEDSDSVQKRKGELPWIEKYRPKKVDDVKHQQEVVTVMKKVLKDETPNLPHMLFYGPPGSGKTSAILAMCNQMYGPKYLQSRVLELNASDDRGIRVIRERVKVFAQSSVNTNPEKTQNGINYPVPPYKIIILDEADALLPDAQAALRRVIEEYCTVTRFCLICNYISRIIDPIVSRCAKFRFQPITRETMSDRVAFIAKTEGLHIEQKNMQQLDEVSQGDLRLAVQYLQGAFKAYGKDLRECDFYELAGWVPQEAVLKFFSSFWSNSFTVMQAAVNELTSGGYSAAQLLSQLTDVVEAEDTAKLNDIQKANILLKISALEKPLQDGSSEELQLLSLGGYCLSVVCGL